MTAENNPKHAAGRAKPSLRHVPLAGLEAVGRVMDLGAGKYGPFNFVESGVVGSVYYDAMWRHWAASRTGEDVDVESGEDHLAHVIACALIMLECKRLGKLTDDRPRGVVPLFHTAGKAPAPAKVCAHGRPFNSLDPCANCALEALAVLEGEGRLKPPGSCKHGYVGWCAACDSASRDAERQAYESGKHAP